MIDDQLDGQLLTLRRVVATAAPPRSHIVAIVERNRVRRTRARRAAGALAAVVVVGTSALVFTALDGGDPADVSANVGAGPDIEQPDVAGGNDVADPDVGDDENCGLAGPDPAGQVLTDDLAGVGDALEARFPSCFGGIVRTGPNSADLYVVDLAPQVTDLAQQLIGPGFTFTTLPSDHPMADVRALKSQIDGDAGQLHAAGIETAQTGIHIGSKGPRVWLGIEPYTPEAVEQIEALYPGDWLLIAEYGEVIPG